MRLKLSAVQALAVLSLSLGTTACARVETSFAQVQRSLSGNYDRFGPNWGGMRPTAPSDSLTVQRIRGGASPQETLRPEPGDVWPREAGPRATLANPEEALRGVPPAGSEPPRRRGSAAAFDPAPGAAPAVISPIFDAPAPPPRANRTDGARDSGQVFQTREGPVIGIGGSGNVQSTISPQGSGLAIREGATTTLIGPGGNVQQVPTPR